MKQVTNYKRLTAGEREEISRDLAKGLTYGQIARNIGRQTRLKVKEVKPLTESDYVITDPRADIKLVQHAV